MFIVASFVGSFYQSEIEPTDLATESTLRNAFISGCEKGDDLEGIGWTERQVEAYCTCGERVMHQRYPDLYEGELETMSRLLEEGYTKGDTDQIVEECIYGLGIL